MRKPLIRQPLQPAAAASPGIIRESGRRRSPGISPTVSVLLLATLCFAPACTPLLQDTGGFDDLYGIGEARQPARDGGEPRATARGNGGAYEGPPARVDVAASGPAGKKRTESDLYGITGKQTDQAASTTGKRASAQDDLYDRRPRGSGKGVADGRRTEAPGLRSAGLYEGAAASRDRSPGVAEKKADAKGPLYEAEGRTKEGGAVSEKSRMTAQEKDDLYSVSQFGSRRAGGKKTEGPRPEQGEDGQASGPAKEAMPGSVAKAAVPEPSGELAVVEKTGGKTVVSPPPVPAAASTPPPAPPAAPGQESAGKPAAGKKSAADESVSPPPVPAASAPSPALPQVAEKKSVMPAAAGPVSIEQRQPPSAPRRPTPAAVTAAKRQDLRPYPDQRREAEDIIEASKKERLLERRLLVINRPPNIQGLTGLLFTNSAYTLPAGKFTVGASMLAEYSSRPEFSVLQIPFTLTYGMTDNLEFGIKAKIVDLDSPIYPDRAHGFGDSEISAKWRFASRRFILPDMAVGLCYIAPTGNENKHLNEVVNWGMKFMAIASLEGRTAGGRVMGIYAEAQAVFIDELAKRSSSTPGAERYGIINGGVLFPVSADNRTQLLAEYSQILYKSKLQPTLIEGNQNAGTAAVRYVTEDFSVTTGLQYINKEKAGDQNTYRFVWKLSLTF